MNGNFVLKTFNKPVVAIIRISVLALELSNNVSQISLSWSIDMDLLSSKLINKVDNLEELRAVQVLRYINEKRNTPSKYNVNDI